MWSLGLNIRDLLEGDFCEVEGSGGNSIGDMGRPQPGPSLGFVGSVSGGSIRMLGLLSRLGRSIEPVGHCMGGNRFADWPMAMAGSSL